MMFWKYNENKFILMLTGSAKNGTTLFRFGLVDQYWRNSCASLCL